METTFKHSAIPLPRIYQYTNASVITVTKATRAQTQRAIENIRYKNQRTMQYNLRRVLRSEQKALLNAEPGDTLAYATILEEHTPWMREIFAKVYMDSADAMYPLVQSGDIIKSYNRRETKEKKDITQEDVYRLYIDEWLRANGGRKISQINRTTMEEIRAVLVNANTVEEVHAALNTYFNANVASRALRIAWTETSTATNIGSLQCVRAVATRESDKIWRTLNDAQVRDSHRSMEASRAEGLEGAFRVPAKLGYDFMQCPGDPTGSAANVVNCRCWTQYEYQRR